MRNPALRLRRPFQRKFDLGEISISLHSLMEMERASLTYDHFLFRHMDCDWNEMSETERETNQEALEKKKRIKSRYSFGGHHVLVITTEAGWSKTTIRLAHEDFVF